MMELSLCLFWAQLLGILSWQIFNTPSSTVEIEISGGIFQLKGERTNELATESIFMISVTRAMLK